MFHISWSIGGFLSLWYIVCFMQADDALSRFPLALYWITLIPPPPPTPPDTLIPYCANRNKSGLLFSSAEMFQKPLWQIVCTQIRLFQKPLWQTVWTQIRLLLMEQSVLGPRCNSSIMLGNYLQQRTSADDIFRCIFFLDALRVNPPPPAIHKNIVICSFICLYFLEVAP